MKKAAAIMMILLMSHGASGLRVEQLNVQIDVDSQGFASITENYTMGFISEFEFNEFKDSAQGNAASLGAWEADYNFFGPHFLSSGNQLTSSAITFDESSKTLTLKYGLVRTFAQLESSGQRVDTYSIPDSRLQEFNIAGTIVIPENTTITIRLPANSEVDASQLPAQARVNGNQIILNGIQSNSISIDYSVLKSIAPRSDDLVQGISNTYIFAPIIALLMVGVYLRRDEIEKRIEDYLVEHSEIKPRESEEIDIDMGK